MNTKGILGRLLNGDASILTVNTNIFINSRIVELLEANPLNEVQIEELGDILHIGNIVYNNIPNEDCNPLEDGVYDILLEKYKVYNPNFQVGAEPIQFNYDNNEERKEPIKVVSIIDKSKIQNEEYWYNEMVTGFNPKPIVNIQPTKVVSFINKPTYITKRTRTVAHEYEELSGSLDKCKYVLTKQAEERMVDKDPKVKILERDFFSQHLIQGIIDYETPFRILAELKYDGVSVVLKICHGKVVSGFSRGDTGADLASDLTPIFEGYEFPMAKDIPEIAVQFEAIMTYYNLNNYNEIKQREYKNCRTAIIGLFGSSDAYLYRDLITLVPIKSSVSQELDNSELARVIELEFLNKYFTNGQLIRYVLLEGNYTSILYQLKKFVEECEYYRAYLPFMYDGIVIEYIDPNIVYRLGRQNSINKYSMAVKFNALKKSTILLNVTFTVGQNGVITPIPHYNPVEFMGAIHTKTTLSSKARFDSLNLRYNDIVDIEYINDVIPYISKPDNEWNANNTNPLIEFPTECPCCGTKLEVSTSGKSIICPNISCPERNISRIAGFMKDMNLKDFSTERMKQLEIGSIKQLIELGRDIEKTSQIIGSVNAEKLKNRIDVLLSGTVDDYKFMGALGFSGLAEDKWKKILSYVTLNEIEGLLSMNAIDFLTTIQGVGPSTIEIIVNEWEFFKDDIHYMLDRNLLVESKGKAAKKKVRFTGFRDKKIFELINSFDYECKEGSVTKDTYVLLVPDSYPDKPLDSMTKVNKANDYRVQVMRVSDFLITHGMI